MIGPFEAGERILLVDQRDRRYLLTLQTGETWHSHGGGALARPADRVARGDPGALGDGDGVPSVPAAAGRLRAEDAEGRPGRLPQGRRRDPGRGGRLPGCPRPGGRDGFGLAHAGAVPGHRSRGPGGLLRPAARVPGGGGSEHRVVLREGAGLARAPRWRRPRRRGERRDLRPRDPGSPGAVGDARAARDRAARRARSSAGTCRRRTRSNSSCSPWSATGTSTSRRSRSSTARGT